MRVTFCETCGAPIDARWSEIVLVCRYCGVQNAPGKAGEPVPPSMPDDGRPRLAVGGRTYLVEGLLGEGDSAQVYRGRWVIRLGELVVIKVQRAMADTDLMRREWEVLKTLRTSRAEGTAYFAALLPEPIGLGLIGSDVRSGGRGHGRSDARGDRLERLVTVCRWRSGYQHTLGEVLRAHPDGVDGRIVVWLLKRLLELLAWTHRSGIVHGAVLPSHVLVHPRDHGAMLVGWSAAVACAGGKAEPLPAVSRAWRELYPDSARKAHAVSAATDVAMAARCALLAAGVAGFDGPGPLPDGLGETIVAAARGQHADAWSLRARIIEQSLHAYGKAAYNPLPMPGWTGAGAGS